MKSFTAAWEALPAERRASILQIAQALYGTGWRLDGGKGKVPPIEALSPRNQTRWVGAAFACEHLMAKAKNDAVQQRAVIDMCIDALTKLRDENNEVKIE